MEAWDADLFCPLGCLVAFIVSDRVKRAM